MARRKAEQWEQARAEYEVRGVSLGDIARSLKVATSSVSRRAKAEGWTQGRMQGLVGRKVAAIKELSEVETQTQELPLRLQYTMDSVVRERLQAEGLLASLDVALAGKAIALAQKATSAGEIETLSRARRNLAPQTFDRGTTVNVNQQQAQVPVHVLPPAPPEPQTALRRALRGDFERDE